MTSFSQSISAHPWFQISSFTASFSSFIDSKPLTSESSVTAAVAWPRSQNHYQTVYLMTHYIILSLSIFTNPSARAGYDTKSIFKRSLTGLNSEFSFSETSCLAEAEEPSLPCYVSIAGGRIMGFIPFPRVLALCEMQSVSSRIWTRVAVSISYNDNHYTTGTTYYTELKCSTMLSLL